MFIDERVVMVRSGDGGDGIVSWRREKREPQGGPAGGDGGDGGNVILIADTELTTFGDMEITRHFRAEHGERGGPSKRSGAKGADRIMRVPVGTTVFDAETDELVIDLDTPNQRVVIAKGGRRGRGNARFATAVDQTPTRADPGTPGETRQLRLELRLLADVGLVGLPNAGKSTLLSRLSNATPRIADYPFTTLEPHLGIVDLPDFTRFVMADLPGLIAGAHEGHGLGDRFLRHVERTRVLVHLVDPYPTDGGDPVEAYRTVRRELEAYGSELASRPEVLVATKADLTPVGEAPGETLRRLAAAADRRLYPISSVTGTGLPALLRAITRELERERARTQSTPDTDAERAQEPPP